MPNSKLQSDCCWKPEGVETEDGCRDHYLAPDTHIATDLKLQILNVNVAGLHLLGERFEFLERMPLLLFISMADRHNVFGLCMALMDGTVTSAVSGEMTVCPPRREPVPCTATVTLQRDVRGSPKGFVWLLQDSSARMRKRETLRQMEQMQALNRLLLTVSHEFRNLLTGIRLHADLAGMTDCPEGRRESLDEIRNSCERAAGLLGQFRAFQSEGDFEESLGRVERVSTTDS